MTPDQLQVLKESAAAGDTTARLMYGLALVQGRFLEQDLDQGLGLIRAAAEGGHPEAMFFLAVYQLDQGEPTPENFEIARGLLEKAAFTGHVKSQVELAKSYLSGSHWPASDEQALMWLRFAAKEGVGVAWILMGYFFLDRGLPQEALHAFRTAEARGENLAVAAIEESLESLRPEGFRENLEAYALQVLAQALGREIESLTGLAAELEGENSAGAAKALSIMYDYGYGVALSPVRATEWLGIAADRGDAEARHFLNERRRIGYLGEAEKGAAKP